jgi:serine/threonine protein kinase
MPVETVSCIAKQSAAATRITRGVSIGFGFLRRHLWLWPILAAATMAAAGLWVRSTIEAAMRVEMAAELEAILNSNVAALQMWLETEQAYIQTVANQPDVSRTTSALVKIANDRGDDVTALVQAEEQAELRRALRVPLSGRRYAGFVFVDSSNTVLACDRTELIGQTLTGPQADVLSRCMKEGPSVSKPFPSMLLSRDAAGQMKAGQPTMFSLAQQRDASGEIIGVLGLRIPPETDFARILQIARPGESGEAYAFDKNGMMLSESRFTDQLIKLALIPDQPGSRSQLNLLIRDPGVDMTNGKRPAKTRLEQPVTQMIAEASQGNSGVNVEGYRNYRGVPVIGAWVWLPAYEMGIAAEQNVSEAYRPLYILRRVFWTLLGLLAASSVLILGFSVLIARMQRAAQSAALAAKELGQYQLEEKLGEGGMGVVYRGRHRMLRRPTAIKLLLPEKTTDEAISRFEREVQLTCQLNHPNTIAIYDYGRTPEGIFYYAMEYLEGLNLDRLVSQYGPQPEGRVIHILRQVCGSLAEAHQIGLVHRDIKPANILLCQRGGVSDVAKVLDFGLVKALEAKQEASLTSAGSVMGTPLFMSPEAVQEHDAVDHRSDLYALAAVGYYLLTGTPPFEGNSIVEICMHHVRTPPQPPSERLDQTVSADLEGVLLKGLAKKPEDRFPTTADFAGALAACYTATTWTSQDSDLWWRERHRGSRSAGRGSATAALHQEPTVVLVDGAASA